MPRGISRELTQSHQEGVCAHCSDPFTVKRKGQKYCSSSCRLDAFFEARYKPKIEKVVTKRRKTAQKEPKII